MEPHAKLPPEQSCKPPAKRQTMSQPSSVEVLVHVAAPSGPKDDAQYRAHADACMGFKPATRLRIHSEPGDDVEDRSQRVGRNDGHGARKSGRCEGLRGTFDDLDMSYMVTKLSADSSGREERDTQTQPDSSRQGDGSVVDDSVEYLPVETALHQASSGDRTVASQFRPDPLQAINSDSSFQTPPSTVPETPQFVLHEEAPTATHTPSPTPTPTPTWDVEKDNSPDNGPIKAHQHPLSFTSTHEAPSPSKRMRFASSTEDIASTNSFNPSFASVVGISTPQPPTQEIVSSQLSLTAEQPVPNNLPNPPLEILPPPPAASSTAKFETHITPSLRMLLEHPKLSRLYKPIYESRPVEKCERGYWSLPISVIEDSAAPSTLQNKNILNSSMADALTGNEPPSSARTAITAVENDIKSTASSSNPCWTASSFSSFWDYLTRYITQERRAGWGVWCVCETSASPSSTASGDKLPGNSIAALDVRIYTWGEVMPHTYLLILLASDRRIRKLRNVEWRDAGENSIIRMT